MKQHEIATLFIKLGIIKYDIRDDGLIDIYHSVPLDKIIYIQRETQLRIGRIIGDVHGTWSTENYVEKLPYSVSGNIYLKYASLHATDANFEVLYNCQCNQVLTTGQFKVRYEGYCRVRKRSETINDILKNE